jgi:hypothetical protein
LVKWAARCFPKKSSRWITQRIKLFNENFTKRNNDEGQKSEKLSHFLNCYLEPDGMFMIRVIGNNSSDFVATDLIQELWKKHYKKYSSKFTDEPQDEDGNDILMEARFPIIQQQQQPPNNRPITYEFLNNCSGYEQHNLQNRKFSRQPQQNGDYFDANNQSRIVVNDETTPFTTEMVNENNLMNRKRDGVNEINSSKV